MNNTSTKEDKVLSAIKKNGRGIELGPLHRPLTPKSKGFNTIVVDHLNTKGLLEKFRFEKSVDITKIEEVDLVWQGGSLFDLINEENAFDYFIASHVIEHIPDVISFLNDAARLLKDDGVLYLIVPDKRFCFDFHQPLTLTPSLITANLEKRKIHTAQTCLTRLFYFSRNKEKCDWTIKDSGDLNSLRLEYSLSDAFDGGMHYISREHQHYVDYHAWYFTPSSFELCMLELGALNLIPLYLDATRSHGTTDHEFFACLSKTKISYENLNQKRSELLWKLQLELCEAALSYTNQNIK